MRTVPSYTDGTTLFVYRWKRIKRIHPSIRGHPYTVYRVSLRMRIRAYVCVSMPPADHIRVVQGYTGLSRVYTGFIQGYLGLFRKQG